MPIDTSIAPAPERQTAPTDAPVTHASSPPRLPGPLDLNPGPRPVGDFSHLSRSHD